MYPGGPKFTWEHYLFCVHAGRRYGQTTVHSQNNALKQWAPRQHRGCRYLPCETIQTEMHLFHTDINSLAMQTNAKGQKTRSHVQRCTLFFGILAFFQVKPPRWISKDIMRHLNMTDVSQVAQLQSHKKITAMLLYPKES